jgi:hypothetical protein
MLDLAERVASAMWRLVVLREACASQPTAMASRAASRASLAWCSPTGSEARDREGAPGERQHDWVARVDFGGAWPAASWQLRPRPWILYEGARPIRLRHVSVLCSPWSSAPQKTDKVHRRHHRCHRVRALHLAGVGRGDQPPQPCDPGRTQLLANTTDREHVAKQVHLPGEHPARLQRPLQASGDQGAAEELLTILKRERVVLDWRKEQATRAAVRVAVEETLDRLPNSFTRQLYAQKCDAGVSTCSTAIGTTGTRCMTGLPEAAQLVR